MQGLVSMSQASPSMRMHLSGFWQTWASGILRGEEKQEFASSAGKGEGGRCPLQAQAKKGKMGHRAGGNLALGHSGRPLRCPELPLSQWVGAGEASQGVQQHSPSCQLGGHFLHEPLRT